MIDKEASVPTIYQPSMNPAAVQEADGMQLDADEDL